MKCHFCFIRRRLIHSLVQMKHQYSTGGVKHTFRNSQLSERQKLNCGKTQDGRQAQDKRKTLSGEKRRRTWHISSFPRAVCNRAHEETEHAQFREPGLGVKDNWMFLIRCSKSAMQLPATQVGCLLNPLQAETLRAIWGADSLYWQVTESQSPQQPRR